VVDRIEVDDHAIRIIGDEATLEQVIVGSTKTARGVRSFVPKWRARRDSNLSLLKNPFGLRIGWQVKITACRQNLLDTRAVKLRDSLAHLV